MDIEGGTLTSTGTWTQTATGEIKYNSPTVDNKIGTLAIAGTNMVTTLASDLHVNAIEFGAGTLNGASKNLHIHGGSGFITTAPTKFTVGSQLASLKIYDCYAQGAFALPDSLLASGVYIDWLYRTSGASANGAWNFGNNKVRFTNNGAGTGTMNLSSYGITVGGLQVGSTTDAANYTIIDFGSGAHTINSLSKANAGTISGTPLQLRLNSSNITCPGALDFTGIKVDQGTSTLNSP